MTPFLLMLCALAILHLPGVRALPGLGRPADKAAVALGLGLLPPAWKHFADPAPFVAMLPSWVPGAEVLVAASGLAEAAVAVALFLPRTRRLAGWAAVALLLAVWPANIHVAISGQYPPGFSQSPLYHWLRVPFQLLYVGWGLWVAFGHVPGLGLRRRFMARLYDRVMAPYEAWISPRRAALLRDVSGTVVEIGPGTGASFPFLDPSVQWIGIEPNPYMHATLRARATERGIAHVEIRGVTAGGMDLPTGSADVVVCSLVLCSVEDPAAVLADIRRVLRPGGRLVFLEHVAAPRGTWLRRLQRVMRPVWSCFADGCHPDRETDRLLEAAGFERLEMERFDAPPEAVARFASPHVAGQAVR